MTAKSNENKIERLTLERRQLLIECLLDGYTGAEIRELLEADGVALHGQPSNRELEAYRQTKEFQKYYQANLLWKQRAQEKIMIWTALSRDKNMLEATANLAVFEALDRLNSLIRGGTLEAKDAAQVATAIVRLKHELTVETETKLKAELQKKKTAADGQTEQLGRREGFSPETIKRIKAIYGLAE